MSLPVRSVDARDCQLNWQDVDTRVAGLDGRVKTLEDAPPPSGGGGSDANYELVLSTNSTWTVPHTLGKRPAVTFLDSAGRDITPGVEITINGTTSVTIVSGVNIATPRVVLN